MNIDDTDALKSDLKKTPDEDPLFVEARRMRIQDEVNNRLRHEEIMEDLEWLWSEEDD